MGAKKHDLDLNNVRHIERWKDKTEGELSQHDEKLKENKKKLSEHISKINEIEKMLSKHSVKTESKLSHHDEKLKEIKEKLSEQSSKTDEIQKTLYTQSTEIDNFKKTHSKEFKKLNQQVGEADKKITSSSWRIIGIIIAITIAGTTGLGRIITHFDKKLGDSDKKLDRYFFDLNNRLHTITEARGMQPHTINPDREEQTGIKTLENVQKTVEETLKQK